VGKLKKAKVKVAELIIRMHNKSIMVSLQETCQDEFVKK